MISISKKHKSRKEWEEQICWEMFKRGYGYLNNKLIESDYYFWKKHNEQDYENGGAEEISDDEWYDPVFDEYTDYLERKEIEEHDNDLLEDFYQDKLSLEEELDSQLIKMLRGRHHLSPTKKLLF